MSLNANTIPSTSGNKKSNPLDSGTYVARVVQVIDFGIQEQRPYKGESKPPANEIGVTYELGTEFLKDEDGNDQPDKPRWISEIFPLRSMGADLAKSTKRMKSLDPDNKLGGDFSKIIGLPCTVSVEQNQGTGTHAGKTFVNVVGVSAPMKGFEAPPLVNEPKVLTLDEPDLDIFESLPDWQKEKIKKGLSFKGSSLHRLLGGSFIEDKPQQEQEEQVLPDDVPF